MQNPVLVIVIAQLFGTSLWFSANSAADDLIRAWGIAPADIGTLTNAVQLGFILGTLSFAISGLADRFAASRIFAVCAVLGALCNAAFALLADGMSTAIPLRFAVGFCLAGVYPLGMKLVVSWVPERAGAALAQLVGMLTLGTALPHGIRLAGAGWSWQATILVSSGLALLAAVMIFRLGDGLHLKRRHGAPPLRLGRVFYAFSVREFRASALGYFGHQWELYAFWTLTPALVILSGLAETGSRQLSGLAFAIIGIGALGCLLGGWWSQRIGSARVAATALAVSAGCCLLFPLIDAWPAWAKIGLLLLWGASVVADSPHFSALSARACAPEIVGSALAIQNSIGFAITMVSIQLGTAWIGDWGTNIAWLLLPGPLLGLLGLYPLWRRTQTR
ncbi:MAG: MFS transporter [Betaproteobacteria bacterium]|nr:MFS transporter [Betaproteobacteria bacterium]MBP6189982.1 MFS transporter [Azonexus sp.]MBP6204216.1 MFS transporter [Azonexus sp.]